MPSTGSNKRKAEHSALLEPLVQEIASRLDATGLPATTIQEEAGVPHHLISRIRRRVTESPSWVDMTLLLQYTGISPNRAASLVGLWKGTDPEGKDGDSSRDERENVIIRLMEDPRVSDETKDEMVRMFQRLARADIYLAQSNNRKQFPTTAKELQPTH